MNDMVKYFSVTTLALVLVGAGHLWAADSTTGAQQAAATPVAVDSKAPNWQDQLKAQLAREDNMEGRDGHTDQVNNAMQKLMEEISQGSNKSSMPMGGSNGGYGGMAAMQQMDRSFYLGPVAENVKSGEHCPKNAPHKDYDISAIGVEISLNQWLDYYPGYMYVLTENVDKVRAEEKRNADARAKEGDDPGAVSNGLQGDMIQPLNIRGNQGDCVIITLRNKLEDDD
ncbi:MAG TPA: hypothetical protein VML36_10130, partial [Nitrospiria bacterium]|nr:hypothetical protein [Nitrospiria bacterium]